MNRFQTPITSGRLWGGHVGGFTIGGVTVNVVNNIATTPPVNSGTQIVNLQTSSGSWDLALGLWDFVDLISVYGGFGAKVQFWGVRQKKLGRKSAVFSGELHVQQFDDGGWCHFEWAELTERC